MHPECLPVVDDMSVSCDHAIAQTFNFCYSDYVLYSQYINTAFVLYAYYDMIRIDFLTISINAHKQIALDQYNLKWELLRIKKSLFKLYFQL